MMRWGLIQIDIRVFCYSRCKECVSVLNCDRKTLILFHSIISTCIEPSIKMLNSVFCAIFFSIFKSQRK